MSAAVAAAVKAAIAILSNGEARKKVGWVIMTILSPLIVLVVLLCAILSGTSQHNVSAVELCFHGGSISASATPEYRRYIEDMRNSFDQLDEVIAEINNQCEDGKIKGYLFWLYMNLSEELMKDAKLRMELIKELYQEGCQNPLLQFEGCCILGEDEQLLDEIDSYELWVLEFGAEEKILNSKLIGRICFLISRNKVFSEEVLWLFLCIYKEYRQSDVLQGICALMIQGNCMDEDCHPYYEEALQRGVQLIGLQEAFLRTIPKGQYPLLPEEILRYFTYSKSLGKEDQSRLFANVVQNRRKYHKVFANYEELIRAFLREE